MKEAIIYIRNKAIKGIYKGIIKQIFFKINPEKVHDNTLKLGRILGSNSLIRIITRIFLSYSNSSLEQEIFGIKFKNPVGLSAGFDKDGYLTDIIPEIGFGFEEIGSITGEKCDGNPKPRLWRLKKSKALVVYYGLKSEGCETIAKRLKEKLKCKQVSKQFKIPVGISIAKTNSKETVKTQAGIEDYAKVYKEFSEIGDYTTLNLSCPNAYGGQPFHNTNNLDRLLGKIKKIPSEKPIFLKIAPDLSENQLDGIIRLAEKYKLSGFVCTNLTKDRKNLKIKDEILPEKGGISGKPIELLSNKNISYIYKKTKGRFVIIGVGGVFSAEDAYKKIRLGASLVQLITGMIFEGPQTTSEINFGLVKLLKKDGFTNISQVVGVDNR